MPYSDYSGTHLSDFPLWIDKDQLSEEMQIYRSLRFQLLPQGKGKAKGRPAFGFEDDLPPALAEPIAAEVLSIEAHPKADKLKICKIDTGSGIFKVKFCKDIHFHSFVACYSLTQDLLIPCIVCLGQSCLLSFSDLTLPGNNSSLFAGGDKCSHRERGSESHLRGMLLSI